MFRKYPNLQLYMHMNFTIFLYLFFQRNQFCHKTASFELIHETFTFWCIYQRRLSKQNLLFVVGNTFSLCLQSWAKIHAVFDSAFNYVVYTVNVSRFCAKSKSLLLHSNGWFAYFLWMNFYIYIKYSFFYNAHWQSPHCLLVCIFFWRIASIILINKMIVKLQTNESYLLFLW